MDLVQALKVYHVVWVVSEPLTGLRQALGDLPHALLRNTSPSVWTPATGFSCGAQWTTQSKVGLMDHSNKAMLQLIDGLLDSNLEGIIILVDGIKLGSEVQAALLKAISDDRRVVFISSTEPPNDFLRDYLKIVNLTSYNLRDNTEKICQANETAFDEGMLTGLAGLRAYRASSVLVEGIRAKEMGITDSIPEYLKSVRRDSIFKDSDGVIKLVEPTRGYDKLIGLDAAKKLLLKLCNAIQNGKKVRGVISVGIAGSGKTSLALATAYEMLIPLYILDISGVYGSLVGESETKMRRALDTLRNLSPGVLVIDEVDKLLAASSRSSSSGDSGVGKRVGAYILNYLENPEAIDGHNHLPIATSNDVMVLPPEFTRAGRFDAMFGYTLPPENILQDVLALYRTEYDLPKSFGAKTELVGLVPAEVEAVCRIASILEASWAEALKYVPVLSVARPEDVIATTDWLKGRAVDPNETNGDNGTLKEKVRKVRK